MLKKRYIIIASVIVSVLLGSLSVNNIIQAYSRVKTTRKIKIVIEMTSSFIGFKFNGLSIRDAYVYKVTNGTIAPLYPYIYLNQIMLQKVPGDDDSYLRMEIPLKVFVSNETVSMVLYNVPPSGYETYAEIKIYDKRGNLIDTYTIISLVTEWETFYIHARQFR